VIHEIVGKEFLKYVKIPFCPELPPYSGGRPPLPLPMLRSRSFVTTFQDTT
jgi:hypothetical protein